MKWFDDYKVHYYYTDYRGVLKPSYICKYMQETANNALINLGPNPRYLTENNFAFILSKFSIKFYSEITDGADIRVTTWAQPARLAVYPRNYRIETDGRTAVEATSVWALVNTREKSILRPDALTLAPEALCDEGIGFEVKRRINLPENLEWLSDYTVQYSDIDTNLHMNNTMYVDRVCEAVFADEDSITRALKKMVRSIDISYNSESLFKETMEIYATRETGAGNETSLYIRAKNKSSKQNIFDAFAVYTVEDAAL